MLSSSALSAHLLPPPPPMSFHCGLMPSSAPWPSLSAPPSSSTPLLKFGIDQILAQQVEAASKAPKMEDLDSGSPPKKCRRSQAHSLPSIAEYLRSPIPPPPPPSSWELGYWPGCCLPPSPDCPPHLMLPFSAGHPGLTQGPGKLSRRHLAAASRLHSSPVAVAAAAAAAGLGGRKCEKCACPYCLDAGKQRQFALAGVKKLHACHLCEKTFQKTSHLRAHINGHNGVRPFVCTWLGCGKSFTRSDELQRHWRTHSGVKHFVCEVCDKGFTRSDHLKKHKRTHVMAKDEEVEKKLSISQTTAVVSSPERASSVDRSSSSSVGPRGEADEEEEYIDVMD